MAILEFSDGILIDPTNQYSSEELNNSSTFDDDIVISDTEEVILPFSSVTGNIILKRIGTVQADNLKKVNKSIDLTDCNNISFPVLENINYLKVRKCEEIALPKLKKCNLINLENTNIVSLPKLTNSQIVAVNIGKIETNASGELYGAGIEKIVCPNLEYIIENPDAPIKIIIDGVLYDIEKIEQVMDDVVAYYVPSVKSLDKVYSVHHKTGICAYGATLEEAIEQLQYKIQNL